jgi:hypothetical protein
MTVKLMAHCDGEEHWLELREDGTMRMLDHDEDMVKAFVAFDAAPPECLLSQVTWREHFIRILLDPGGLWTWSIGGEQQRVPLQVIARMMRDWVKHASIISNVNDLLPDLETLGLYLADPDMCDNLIVGDLDRLHPVASDLSLASSDSPERSLAMGMLVTLKFVKDLYYDPFVEDNIRHFYKLASKAADYLSAAVSWSTTDITLGIYGVDETKWQRKHAAKLLNQLDRGEPWQPL